MRETKSYQTYLDYATGVTPPKKARKFKKPASPKLTIVSVSPKEPVRKSKRVKRPAKKSTNMPTASVVIRETPILLDKIQKSKSYQAALEHKELYDALVKSYKLDKDLFDSYGNTYSLKRDRDDKDKDEDPSAGSDRGLKKRKTSKDAEPTKGPNTKESKSSSSKGTKSQRADNEYGYLREIENRLTNLSGDDVPNFATALLNVFKELWLFNKRGRIFFNWESKVTRRRSTSPNELYKFSDDTLTRLRTLLDDITKNIQMEYLPQRRWSSLEKKRV
ncbi:hypothetical protein Tco_0901941 [Tanacetum coccineum]